jgi:PhnB protein
MRFLSLTPYLCYNDAGAAADWLSSTVGFEEINRFADEDGKVSNVTMRVGDSEVWLDGGGRPPGTGGDCGTWTMVWVDDVDSLHERVTDAGIECAGPMDRPWGVREVQVRDPEGLNWGFIQRLR